MTLKTTSAALGAVAVLALVVVQFVPWATYEVSNSFAGFDFDASIEAGTWKVTAESGGGAQDESWFSDDAKEYSPGESDLTLIRIAIPVLLAGLVTALVGCLLTLTTRGAGAVVTFIAAGLTIAATVLFAVGLEDFYGDAAHKWGVSFFLAIGTCALLLASGVTGVMQNSRSGTAAN